MLDIFDYILSQILGIIVREGGSRTIGVLFYRDVIIIIIVVIQYIISSSSFSSYQCCIGNNQHLIIQNELSTKSIFSLHLPNTLLGTYK